MDMENSVNLREKILMIMYPSICQIAYVSLANVFSYMVLTTMALVNIK